MCPWSSRLRLQSTLLATLVSRLAEQIGPSKATVALRSAGSLFGQALEAALKGWGYAVLTDKKADSGTKIILLAYVVLPLDGRFWRVFNRYSRTGSAIT